MNKTQTESEARRQQAIAMNRKIDSLRHTADEATRKMLDEILTAGLDAYFSTKAGV